MQSALFILPNNPGDVLMGLAVVDAFHRTYPAARLEYVVDAECRVLVEAHPFIHRVHVLPRSALREQFSVDPALALAHLNAFLANLGTYDLAANLFQDDIGAYLLVLVDAQHKVGKLFDMQQSRMVVRDPWSQYLFAIPAQRRANALHAVDVYLRMCGISAPTNPRITLPPLPPLAQTPVPTSAAQRPRRIAIQAGSAWAGKTWPPEHWEALISLLTRDNGWEIHLLGAPAELELCQRLAAAAPEHTVIWAGRTTLLQVGTLLRTMDLLITGDTFAMHMAAAVHCPILALFGPSNPVETGPYQVGAQILLAPGPHTLNFDFAGTQPSLPELSVETVLRFLLRRGAPPAHAFETHWSLTENRLVLGPLGGALPPCPPRAPRDPRQVSLAEIASVALPYWQAQLTALQKILQETSDAALLRTLEAREAELAGKTEANLALEIYRIQLNALALQPLENYFRLRSALVQEWTDLAIFAGKRSFL